MKDLGLDTSNGWPPAVIAAAVVAVVVVIVGSFVLIADGPTPAELAAADSANTTEYVPPAVSPWYCDNPQPRTDAPEPSADGPNTFAVFEFANGERTESSLDVFAADDPRDAAYALCLTGVENGEDVECVGYSSGRTFRYEAMDWTATLVQLSTGEQLVRTDVLTGAVPDCPTSLAERGAVIPPDVSDLRYHTVSYAEPGGVSETHLGSTLDANSGFWCDTPSALPDLGTGRAALIPPQPPTTLGPDGELGPEPEPIVIPPDVYVSGRPSVRAALADALTIDTVELDRISHIVCVAADWPVGRSWPRCDYPDHVLAFRPYDYRVSVVDAATGELVGSNTFRGETSCPPSVDFDTDNEIRDAGIPAAAAVFIERTAGLQRP